MNSTANTYGGVSSTINSQPDSGADPTTAVASYHPRRDGEVNIIFHSNRKSNNDVSNYGNTSVVPFNDGQEQHSSKF